MRGASVALHSEANVLAFPLVRRILLLERFEQLRSNRNLAAFIVLCFASSQPTIEGKDAYILDDTGREVKMPIVKKTKK